MKILIMLSIFLVFPVLTHAQDWKRNEIQLGVTPYANPFFGSDLTKGLFRYVSNDRYIATKSTQKGIYASYRVNIRKHFSLGMTIGVTKGIRNVDYVIFSPNWQYRHTTWATAFEPTFIYKTFSKCKLYGLAGVGATWVTQKKVNSSGPAENAGWFTYQLTPFGIRFGENVGVFAELGYGYKGIANAGVSVEF